MTHRNPSCPSESATLSVAWEQSFASGGRPIAVEITFTPAAVDEAPGMRLPLSLGLAIDRSGSMGGGKLDAARHAALGVLESLAPGERFAATAFDSEVIDVCRSQCINERTVSAARETISSLRPGGSTALFDGFARAAELVAMGGDAASWESWVIVLSDGQGNHGLCDPREMRRHAAALAERGIRTISVGIGADYEAGQLTALSDGGCGEFHHASRPEEIVEVVLGELGALRHTAARGLELRTGVRNVDRCILLGGDVKPFADDAIVHATSTRFDRVASGRTARAVLLVWPDGANPSASVDASWTGPDQSLSSVRLESGCDGPAIRDVGLACRAAELWQAAILAHALELNEAGEYHRASSFVERSRRSFEAYVRDLPVAERLLALLDRVGGRVARPWRSMAHREAYSMTTKIARGKEDLREEAPRSFEATLALDVDDE